MTHWHMCVFWLSLIPSIFVHVNIVIEHIYDSLSDVTGQHAWEAETHV